MIENTLFDYNYSAGDGGAAVFKNNSTVAVRYVTATDNQSLGQGAAFHNSSLPALPVNITSSILWNNYSASSTVVANSQASGPWAARYTTAQQQLLSGGTNSQADPLLQVNYWTLRPGSPAINASDPLAPIAKDLDGNLRPAPPDRGCFEFADSDGDGMSDAWERMYFWIFDPFNASDRDADYDGDGFTNFEEYLAKTHPGWYGSRPAGPVLYVDPRPGFGKDFAAGTYSAPVLTIKRAIELCTTLNGSPTTTRICLRDGTYKGTSNKNLTSSPVISGVVAQKKFYLKSINGKGRVTIDLENSGRFLTIQNPGFDGSCGLEGLTIRRGAYPAYGGAVLVTATASTSQPFLVSCTIAGCNSYEGGAISVQTGSLFMDRCELFANEAMRGGAVSVGPNSLTHAVYARDCTLSYNAATQSGGAIYTRGVVKWTGGSLFRNTAPVGGAVHIAADAGAGTTSPVTGLPIKDFTTTAGNTSTFTSGSWTGWAASSGDFGLMEVFLGKRRGETVPPSFTGCRMVENNAWSASATVHHCGGAIAMFNSSARCEALTIERNRSSGTHADGGGIWFSKGQPLFRACILRLNETTGNGGGAAGSGDEASFFNCAFCDNTAAADGGALDVPDEPGWVRLLHCTVTHNRSTTHAISSHGQGTARVENSLVWFNRNQSDTAASITALSEPYTMGSNLEILPFVPVPPPPPPAPVPTGNISVRPTLAWDHYHLIGPASLINLPAALPALTAALSISPTGTPFDIENEPRSRTALTNEPGCDEWTDSFPAGSPDGIPDWYAKLIAGLNPDGGLTVNANVSALRPWGASMPTVAEMFDFGLNPHESPATTDSDSDGLTNAEEIQVYATSPVNVSSRGGNRTDAQVAGRGGETDTDKDWVNDDFDVLPLDARFRWPKAPERMAYIPISLGPNTYAWGVTKNGKILVQDRSVPPGAGVQQPLYVVSQDDPQNRGASLPETGMSARRGLCESYSYIMPGPGASWTEGLLPRIMDSGDNTRILAHFTSGGDAVEDIPGSFLGLGPVVFLKTEIPAPTTPPALRQDMDPWTIPTGTITSAGLWQAENGHIFGTLQYGNGPILYETMVANNWFDPTGDNGVDASAIIISRWQSSSTLPEEYSAIAPGNMVTHRIIPDAWSAPREGNLNYWEEETEYDPTTDGIIPDYQAGSHHRVFYNSVSTAGAVLFSDSVEDNPESYPRYLYADSIRYSLREPAAGQFGIPASVFDLPVSPVDPSYTTFDHTKGRFLGAVVAGGFENLPVHIWERDWRRPDVPELRPKNVSQYLDDGSVTPLVAPYVRDISKDGEILFATDGGFDLFYPPYDQIWRNGRVHNLQAISAKLPGASQDSTYRAVGFGKDGAIIANLIPASSDDPTPPQAVILYPMRLDFMKPTTNSSAEWSSSEFHWANTTADIGSAFEPYDLDAPSPSPIKFKLSFDAPIAPQLMENASNIVFRFAISHKNVPDESEWRTVSVSEFSVHFSADDKQVFCSLPASVLRDVVRPTEPSDSSTMETFSYDVASTGHFGDSDSFDSAMHQEWAATASVIARTKIDLVSYSKNKFGNWTGMPLSSGAGIIPSWTSGLNKQLFCGGGANYLRISSGEAEAVATIKNQADILYFSGHGHSNDGGLDGQLGQTSRIYPEDVKWDSDLEMVIIAGCAVLDYGDKNGNYDDDNADGDNDVTSGKEIGGPVSKVWNGERWAKTGPKILLGYNYGGPSDGSYIGGGPAQLISAFIKRLQAPSEAAIARLWVELNLTLALTPGYDYANACAIYKVGGHSFYTYYDKNGASPGVTTVQMRE